MALSSIQGQTDLGSRAPSNLIGAIPIEIDPPEGVPAGFGVSVVGRNENVEEGTYAIVFGYSVPAGKVISTDGTGSMRSSGEGPFDYMKVTVADDASQRGTSTVYWEVWFTQTAAEGNDWSTQVQFSTSGGTWTYSLSKRRTGGEL